MKSINSIFAMFIVIMVSGCTTTQQISRSDGSLEYLIACGAALGWNICYDKANQICPSGYKTLSEDAGFNRKELRIACQSANTVTTTKASSDISVDSSYIRDQNTQLNKSDHHDSLGLLTYQPISYHALVIGIDQYNKISKLKTAVSDAKAVATTLSSEYGFTVKTLLNATRADIIAAINDYRKKLTVNDSLLIYYAGHGALDKEVDEGYWLPVDATEDNDLNWIPTSSEISGKLRAIEARHVMVVSDSCYSGKLTRGVVLSPKSQGELSRLQGKKARKILSSGGLEPVVDTNGKENHSVFASAFLKALRENNQIMTATDLFSIVRSSVMRNADQTPEFGVIHKAGDDGGDFVFVKKR